MALPDATTLRVTGQLPLFEAAVPPVGSASSVSQPPATLAEAIDAYCDSLAAMRRAAHTVRSTQLDLGGLLEQLGNLPLKAIQPGHLAAHVQWLRGHRRNGTASVRRKIATLKGCFRHAQASGWLATDPARGLIYPPPARPPLTAVTGTELDAVVAAAGD